MCNHLYSYLLLCFFPIFGALCDWWTTSNSCHCKTAPSHWVPNKCSLLKISMLHTTQFCTLLKNKDLFHRWQNVSNLTLYPDVLKIKTNCCETKFYKNAICLLFTNFQIHHLATLLPGRPSNRVARYGFVNKKMAFLKIFVWQQSLFCFQTSGYNVEFDTFCQH